MTIYKTLAGLNAGYVFNFVCTSYGLALVARLESI